MVELKVNGTEYQETMKTSEQINTLTTNQVKGVISTNCPPSVLLTRKEDQLLNGEKNGETAGLLRYEGKATKSFQTNKQKVMFQIIKYAF